MSLPPARRGASLPANPYPFVDGHHAPRHEPTFHRLGVVLLSPQALVLSSTGTTPTGSNVSSGGPAWCFPPRKSLFLRRRAPRPQARTRVPPARRGASLPANPCPFVGGHHAPRSKREFRRLGVVLLSPQALVPSSTGTTPSGTNRPSPGRPHLDVGNGIAVSFCSPPKSKKRIARYVQCASLLNDSICLNNPICVPFPPRPCGLR